jgi:hypothetical protein
MMEGGAGETVAALFHVSMLNIFRGRSGISAVAVKPCPRGFPCAAAR